jgi:stearoyl-CoA desaturase (delta-9 desaturase)
MTVTTSEKLALSWPVIIYMTSIHLFALLAFLPRFFSWQAVTITLVLYWVTANLGITLGYHRLVSHRSFETPKWLEYFLIFCGTLACEGGPISWIGLHRIHHKYSDHDGDPHDSNRGFWWSHLGWMMVKNPANEFVPKYTKDINEDPFYQFCEKYFIPMQVVLGLLLFLVGRLEFCNLGHFLTLSFSIPCYMVCK